MNLKQDELIFSLNATCLVKYDLYFLGGKPYSLMNSNYLFQFNTFSKCSYNWMIKNDIPLYTIKPTMSYNPNKHSLLLFGGQIEFQSPTSTIFEISLKDFTCIEIHPKTISEAPRQRYGHCAEFRYPYLIVFGGKSFLGLQNDLWTFNFESLEWTELKKATKAEINPRFFFGSTFKEDTLYLFGGLNGEEQCYSSPFDSKCVLKDLMKIDLKSFFESGESNSLCWEQICKQIPEVDSNFGWNVEYVDGKFVLFCSIINCVRNPQNEIIMYDPQEKQTIYCLDYLPLRPQDDFYFQCRIENCSFLTSLSHQRGSSYCINLLNPEPFDFTLSRREVTTSIIHRSCILSGCLNLSKYKQFRQHHSKISRDMHNLTIQIIESLQDFCRHQWISLQYSPFIHYSNYVQSEIKLPIIFLHFKMGKILPVSRSSIKERSKYFNCLFQSGQKIGLIEVNELFKKMRWNCIQILNIYIHKGRLILPHSFTIAQCKQLILFAQYYLISDLAEICTWKLLAMQTKKNYLNLIKFAQKNQYKNLEQHLWNATIKYYITDQRERSLITRKKISKCCLSSMLDKNRFYFMQKIVENNQTLNQKSKK